MTSEVRHGLLAAIFEDSRQARDEAHLVLRDTAAGFEWVQSPGCSFALAVSSAPHGLAESTLGAAFALHDRLAPRSVRVACDVLNGPPDPKQPEYHAALRRLDRRLRLAETKGLSIVASRTLIDRLFTSAEFRFDPIAESAESVFAVSRHGAFRVEPTIGRYVVEAEIGDEGRVDAIQRYIHGGLLDLSRCPSAIDVGAAISDAKGELVVIAGDAWLGKTFCALALKDRATRGHLTDFETPAPDWEVPGFLASSGRRLWIINAADEADRGGMPLGRIFNQLPSSLPPELTVVVFTRPDGSLPALTGRGWPVRQFALLPLDPAGAMRELGLDVEEWVRVHVAARSLSWSILTFAELREIADRVRGGREVDRGLRDDLLRRRCGAGRRGARPQVQEHKLFDGARLLAAIAGLSGRHSFQRGGGAGFNVVEHVQDLVTAVERLENSEVLVRTGDSLQFAAAHLEEDLAASHLAEHLRQGALSATDLRTLVHDGVTVRSEVRRIVTLVEERLDASARKELRTELEANAAELFQELRAVLRRRGEVLSWAEDALVMRTLGTVAVHDEVARILSAGPATTPAEVHFALRLALMHRWEAELGSIAVEVALSGAQRASIRELAAEIALRWAYSTRRPMDHRLMALARATTRDDPEEPLAALRATVLEHALEHGELSASEAASLAAPQKRQLFDARVTLLQRIGEKMDASLARELIDAARGARPGRLHPGVVAYLHRQALRALVEADPWEPEDVPRVEQILDGGSFEVEELLTKRLDRERKFRRTLYLRRRCSRGRLDVDLVFPEDAAWLVETVVGSQPPPESVRTDLYRSIAFLPEPEAERAREALRACGAWDSLHDAFTEGPRRFRALKEERENEAVAVAQKVVLLEEIIAELTDVPSPTSRLHWLGDMVWGPKHNGTNVSGNFDTLGAAGQKEVLAAARSALLGAPPSELPIAKASFATSVLDEGEVFRQLCLVDTSDWLDDALIAKWLPTTLFATFSGTKGTDRVVERCYGVSPRATTAAVLADIRRTDGSFLRAHYVPEVLHRDAGFLQGLAGFAQQWGRDPQTAPAALDAMGLLLRVAPDEPATRETLAALRGDPHSTVREEVLGIWLMHQPTAAAAETVAAACVDERSTRLVTKGLAGVWRWRDGIGAWPIEVVAPVARALARHVPREEVQRDGADWVTDEERLQEIRDVLVGRLFRHAEHDPAAAAARDEITRISEYYATWAAGSAQYAALADKFASIRDLLAARTRPAPSVEEVVGVLRGTGAIVERARDLAEHLRWRLRRAFDQMDQSDFIHLYYDRSDAGEYPPRYEEHLQQFVLRELKTVGERSLPGLSVHREPSENATNEPDFIARVTGHEVPIEVKWSHNSDLRGGLIDQLARRYLREAPGTNRRTHGLYLVGWSGDPSDPEKLQQRLEDWAQEAQDTHHVTVLPLVLDVRHPRSRPK